MVTGVAVAGLCLSGVGALVAGVLVARAPWPIDVVVLGRAVQIELVFVWGGLGAMAAAFTLWSYAARRPT